MAFTAQKAIQGKNRSGGWGATELCGVAECYSERRLWHPQSCVLVWSGSDETETFPQRERQTELIEASQVAPQNLEPQTTSF